MRISIKYEEIVKIKPGWNIACKIKVCWRNGGGLLENPDHFHDLGRGFCMVGGGAYHIVSKHGIKLAKDF